MNQHRVVITGIGLVNSLGRTLEDFGEALFDGQSCIGPLEGFDIPDDRYRLGGQIHDFDIAQDLPDVQAKRLYRYSQFALVAADRAIRDAGLSLQTLNRHRIGTSFGTAAGSLGEIADEVKRFIQRGSHAIGPNSWAETTWSACTAHIANHFDLWGPTSCQSAGCVTGFDTIIWGVQQISEGLADVMVVGGTDTPFHPYSWSMMCRSGILAPVPDDGGNVPRPFSVDRNGLALIEGAATIVLESEAHARLRGARIHGEYLAGVTVNSGTAEFDLERIRPVIVQVIQATLREAGIPPTEIDWVNAHATGHPLGDRVESEAIEIALGPHAFCIPVSSIRGAVGQSFASGGGLQAAASCLAIHRQQVPPTINFTAPSEGCRLDYVPNKARFSRVRTVLMNSAGVGGIHSSLIIGTYQR